MHLNRHTDYALRLLMALAADGGQLTIDEIASRYGISPNHLAKIAQRLQAMGHVQTIRGRGGGLRLARPAQEINVGSIVRSMETLDNFVDCMGVGTSCAITGVCGLQGALRRALDDFLKRLDNYTLADLIPDAGRFQRQLAALATVSH